MLPLVLEQPQVAQRVAIDDEQIGEMSFGNPAEQVAAIYRDEIAARAASFSAIDFAIRDAGATGRGHDTYAAFARVLAGHGA